MKHPNAIKFEKRLLASLLIEINRVEEVAKFYERLGTPGKLGLQLMRDDIKTAKQAIADLNHEQMTLKLKSLKNWEG